MAIQALSSVTNKGNSNISFEKRGEKPAKGSVSSVTSPLKAVPLAALIAMSPLTTTNAENIMRAENNANRIELAEAPPSRVLIYGESFTTQNGRVGVMAINTKGGTDSFDKILLTAGGYTFEAKNLLLREGYLYSSNGVKEGPLRFKEVIAETEIDGKKARLSFIDSNIVNYVETLVAQPTNQSNIKGVRKANLNLVVYNSKGSMLFLTDEELKDYLENSILYKRRGTNHNWYDEIMTEVREAKRLDAWERRIQGSHGNYIMKFYDTDGNPDNAEGIIIQKEGDRDGIIKGVVFVKPILSAIDDKISAGVASVIRIGVEPFFAEDEYITDDIVADEIVKFYNSPKYNKPVSDHISPITVTELEERMVLGEIL